MNQTDVAARTAIIIGASGQDGYFLTERLLGEGWRVHATVRRAESARQLTQLAAARESLQIYTIDLSEPAPLFELLARVRPEEIYNLAGQSSVSRSFRDPLLTWRTNADFVAGLLEALRLSSPATRFYQASSTDMFGGEAGGSVVYDERSVLNPQSPYASAKAAAHLLCHAYRQAYNLRIACGILSNHESHRRPAQFLTRKITDHVCALRRLAPQELPDAPPLRMGNLKIRRDWGFAPDYVEGMRLILRQINVRTSRRLPPPVNASNAEAQLKDDGAARFADEGASRLADEGASYRDYVLGTGRAHAVWELVDAAFRLAGFALEWELAGDEAARWRASFRETGRLAVEVDASLLRPADPLVIQVAPRRAREELGWSPREGLEVFLKDMLDGQSDAASRKSEGGQAERAARGENG